MRRFRQMQTLGLFAATMLLTVPYSARAGYEVNGYDLGLVKSESGLAHSAASILTNPLFTSSGRDTEVTTSFTLPSCQTVNFARLYLDVYSGTPYRTGTLAATLNGQALSNITIGGTGDMTGTGTPGDGNPSNYDPNSNCVYGSGYGYWQVALSSVAPLLRLDGSANTLTFTISDPNSTFDGRVYGASLATIYSDPSIDQTLDYQLFEGDGYMRKTAGSTNPKPGINLDRSLTISNIDTGNVVSATYTAGYATGHAAQTDQVYFNGNALGAVNNVATVDNNTELHGFDVASYLADSNSVYYSIDQSVLGGTGESSLHADLAMLTVTHPVPEPSAICLATLGIIGFLTARWRFRRSTS